MQAWRHLLSFHHPTLYLPSERARFLHHTHTFHTLVGSRMERYAEHVPSNSARLSRRCMDAAPSRKQTEMHISNDTTPLLIHTHMHTHTDLHHLIYFSPPAAAGCSGATVSVSPWTSSLLLLTLSILVLHRCPSLQVKDTHLSHRLYPVAPVKCLPATLNGEGPIIHTNCSRSRGMGQ